MPSGSITGLSEMKWMEMDRVSQGMIDGCSNYISDPVIAKNCDDCTRSIDLHIDAQLKNPNLHNAPSLLSSQLKAGMSIQAIKANIKLAISGGQNEPRDAIAGTIGTLLENRSQPLIFCLLLKSPALSGAIYNILVRFISIQYCLTICSS